MAKSPDLMFKARDLLATPSHEGLTIVVDQLFKRQETDEYKTARALYDFCVANLSNCLTLKLLKLYLHSIDDVVRFRSIFLLYKTLTDSRNGSIAIALSLVSFKDIKPLVISCLKMPNAKKSDGKILRRIVSFVAFSVVKLDNRGWDELGDCILFLANTDPLKAFSVFLDLPLLGLKFVRPFLEKLVEEVYKVLQDDRDEEDWSLALETAIKLGIQIERRFDLTREILGNVLKSAGELVKKGKEQFLQRGLARLVKFLEKDSKMCEYSSEQCGFVSEFAFKIGTYTEEAARNIYQMVTKLENHVPDPAFKLEPSLVEKQRSELELYKSLEMLPPVEILSMVALTRMSDESREVAMRRVHDFLCDHTSGKAVIGVSEIRKLKKLLISCLAEVGLPENTFKILGQVVFHVAHEMLSFQEDTWSDLWVYIGSQCKTQFENTVYIFQCLTMMLEDKEFVIPAIENLLPEITTRLNPPRELLVDNSCWVLAFVGGFCAAIHLLEFTSYAGSVKEISDQMIGSVGELVERGMEVGLVRRALRDLESVVKKQVEWYDANEYRFCKTLLRRLYTIRGLGRETMFVVWRTNKIFERGTPNVDKEL
ncbi:unnamed protein product [Microthlaspi erraticum]|uniref:DUF577 domain-containing protein n=1 Tax=Microthlaspi erraticum TaxID=1685480 RepID=A0A6D2JHJ7_9BRAS|nr:unnamed protein product [Microthlaspi erraticum]